MSGFQDIAIKSVKQKNKEVLTKEQQLEVIKCALDPLYFIETYIKVQHPTKGAIPLQLYDFQRTAIENFKNNRHNIVLFSRQMGKALDITTPILTPSGFKPLNDIDVGDTIYGPDGLPTEITYVTDTMYDRPCYKIVFSNGETIIADQEHLWSINVPKRKTPIIVTTLELIDQLEKYKKYNQQIHITHTEAIQFPESSIDVKPIEIGKQFTKTGIDIMPYIINSIDVRKQLLLGITSEIGDCQKSGLCTITHKDESIVDRVQFLLSSLGTKSRKIKTSSGFHLKFYESRYDVFTNKINLKKQYTTKNTKQQSRLYIKSITSTEQVPVKCITVDNADSMFLCGNTLIPTHNTTIAAAFLLWYATFQKDKTILVVAHNQKGAIEILDRIKYSYKELPFFLKEAVLDFNKTEMKLDNGSRIVCRATQKDASRGLSVSLLYQDELQFINPNIQSSFYSSIRPTLQCVAGDTLVLTQNGYVKIEDLHIGKEVGDYFEIDNLETFGKDGMEKVSHGYVQPHSDTLIVTTERGFKLEVTPHHPLYTFAKDGYMGMRRTDELFTGDMLRIQYNMNVFGTDTSTGNEDYPTITEELGYLLGALVAEGWIYEKNKINEVSIQNINEDFKNKFKKQQVIVPFNEYNSNTSRVRVNNKKLVKLLKDCGFKPEWKALTKQTPSIIFRQPKNIQREYIKAMFDGDGCASGRLLLTSISKKLLAETQLILLNFGILQRIRVCTTKEQQLNNPRILPHGKPIQSAHDSFNLIIDEAYTEKFMDEIGFFIPYKQSNLEGLSCKKYTIAAKSKKTPQVCKMLNDIMVETGKGLTWFRKKHNIRLDKAVKYTSSKAVITENLCKKLYSALESESMLDFNKDIYQKFYEFVYGDFIWDTIVSIEVQNTKTYDFTVPKTHSFLQNGILGSNTGGAQIITSTPGQDDDLFAQLWRGANDNILPNGEEAEVGKNGYKPQFAIYSDHPDRDEKFAQEERAAMGEEKFLREHENRFISFKETLIDPLVLERLEPKEHLLKTGEVRWFKNIEFDKSYFVCLDPSLGTASDWQAIQIIEMPTMEHVGEWQSNTTPPKGQVQVLYDILNYIAFELDLDVDDEDLPIYWSFENNGIGEAVLQTVMEQGVDMFPGTLVQDKKTSRQPRHRKGLNTTNKNKLLACSKFKSLVDTDRFKPRQVGVIKQLKNFTANGASYSAKGQNDDLVMALILTIRLIEMVRDWEIYDPDVIKDDIETEFREPLPIIF